MILYLISFFFYFNKVFSQIITTWRIRHTKCVCSYNEGSTLSHPNSYMLKKIWSVKISVSSSKCKRDTSTLFMPKFFYIFEFFIFYFEQIYWSL